jgi:hypothetical protein
MNNVDKLAQATKNSFDKVDAQFIDVNKNMKDMESRINKEIGSVESRINKKVGSAESRINKKISQSQKEIIYEFKALAENIHHDVAGANKDEISLIKQKQDLLTKRIVTIEHKVGV